jgi:nucleotide-binding universal stress UspA family protein
VVPEGRDSFAGGQILVAWDGRAKAARALNVALPLLREASHVEPGSVAGEKDLGPAVSGADFAPHLTRHGIKVGELILPALDGDVAETLRNHANLIQADMIVMGAYVHSRLCQMMLGGTTRSLLKNCPVPLFLLY